LAAEDGLYLQVILGYTPANSSSSSQVGHAEDGLYLQVIIGYTPANSSSSSQVGHAKDGLYLQVILGYTPANSKTCKVFTFGVKFMFITKLKIFSSFKRHPFLMIKD